MAGSSTLPHVPVKHSQFIPYVQSHPDTPLAELLEPYKQYDAKLREVFAQEPDHPALDDPYLNIVPVFNGHEQAVKVRARNLENETEEERDRYIMTLSPDERRPSDSPAIVEDLKSFRHNFTLFCESSLVDLDWSNVVAAGSSVVTCLLPVHEQHRESKRALRKYYHETIAPASDVDLFIYGLNEEEAVKKIIEIEKRIKDSILTETTTIRTKNAITIASQYPTRHIQIVLRIYRSVSEILTGFDVDCSCAAYDGKQIWAAPRALTAYMTQTNTLDLTRRSPSYESRLSKYSHRGFEVHWPLLERSRIDPTIFERNFARTVGLARLLVLERLPSKSEREAYMDERRKERGRPAIKRYRDFSTGDNIKENYEDEIAEWVEQEDVSDYHTFTIPYGPRYHAKKIEKLLYSKDLLLNSEWNKPKDREVDLHRHPAFFGYAVDVINDCCGFCPKPVTPEEHDVAEEEAKIYVSGKISFIKDDPGRQAIGSFNPITDDDWTEMAYVGNTAQLCQAIVNEDLEHVVDWLEQEGSDPNTRDYTGRTPLHLAVISSTPEIVKALIDHGARLVARLADGRTALHLAAARGNVEMVKAIMQKSEENEEEEAKKEDARKKARIAARETRNDDTEVQPLRKKARIAERETKSDENETQPPNSDEENGSDVEMIDAEDAKSEDDAQTTTTGSYLKVKEPEKTTDNAIPEDDEDEPDVYDVNVLAWDLQCSPLHLAILNGHTELVQELVQSFGADVLLPIKLLHDHDKSPRGAILTLVLSLKLPLEKAREMTKTLLKLGASCAQADTNQVTSFHYISNQESAMLDVLKENDEPAMKRAINHLGVPGSKWSPDAKSPLMSAILKGDGLAALKLLELGASPSIEFKDWMNSVEAQHKDITENSTDDNRSYFVADVEQPIILAVNSELPDIALRLLDMGVDPNVLTKITSNSLKRGYKWYEMESLLDVVQKKIKSLQDELEKHQKLEEPVKPRGRVRDGANYFEGSEPGSYKHYIVQAQLEDAKYWDESDLKSYEQRMEEWNELQKSEGRKGKTEALESFLKSFRELEQKLLDKAAKTFKELHPDFKVEESQSNNYDYSSAEEEPFEPNFDFSVHNLTDETRDAYIRLFEAAWEDDLDTIKSLTLASWGESMHSPLRITVNDSMKNTVFGLAVLRNHRDLARAIVEICFAQYEPAEDEPTKPRYRLGSHDDDDDESDSSDVPVYKELIDDRFTIENIGELSTKVKSDVTPHSFMKQEVPAWDYSKWFFPEKRMTCGIDGRDFQTPGHRNQRCDLATWSLITNDKSLFSFMLDLDIEWADKMAKNLDGSSGIPSFSGFDFDMAIEYGRIELLAEMIKHTGAGLDMESLVQTSGVKYHEKPKFYQGLSVHGKKRPGWIDAARGTYTESVTDSAVPLLTAAFKGSLQSVEWLLSDAPARHYLDFAEAYKHDKYIEHLNNKAGGFEKLLKKWLGTRRELALHMAVMAEPRPESYQLIKYLIEIMPHSLEHRSTEGYTPLALAFSLHRYHAAKILIDAGADQTVRLPSGSNILDIILVGQPSGYSHYYQSLYDKAHVHRLLSLIDTRLIPSLLTERTSVNPGSLTPIAHAMQSLPQDGPREHLTTNILGPILDLTAANNYECLELLDGSGDTPLHWAVRNERIDYIKMILDRRPDLLYRENSVGRTALEMAEEACVAHMVSDPSWLCESMESVINRGPETFVKGYKKDDDERAKAEKIRDICREVAAKNPRKRKLVSLLDANEVANRLAKRHMGRRSAAVASGDDEDGVEESGAGGDEVSNWYNQARKVHEIEDED